VADDRDAAAELIGVQVDGYHHAGAECARR
jgi:hypothetical protein